MRKYRLLTKTMLGASLLLAGGTVLGNGCINTVASLPICGAVLTFCTPADQLNLLWPMLTTPDFAADPSCTIPGGCGTQGASDLMPPTGGPGGTGTPSPSDTSGGGVGGGGGGV